jgi:biopolymer transport protein ExbD
MSGRARDLAIAAFIALAACQPAPVQTPDVQAEPQKRDLVLVVKPDGSIIFDGTPMTEAELDKRISEMDASGDKRIVHVQAMDLDGKAAFETVHRVSNRLGKSNRAAKAYLMPPNESEASRPCSGLAC